MLESVPLGVSLTTLLKLIGNVSVDVLGGTIPFVSDVFDAVWKAKMRNLELALEDLTWDHDRSPRSSSERSQVEIE